MSTSLSELTVQGKHSDDVEQERLVCEYMDYLKPESVLDVGCGKGRMSQYCKMEYVGIDRNFTLITEAKARFGSEKRKFHVLKADDLNSFHNQQFDLVLSVTTLMHNKDISRIILSMLRVAKRYVLLIESKKGTKWVPAHDYGSYMVNFELWDYRSLCTSPRSVSLALMLYRRKGTRLPEIMV